MNDSDALVSIIIPAFNVESYIKETIESVLAQTYKNIEIIVIDDGSKDKTSEIIYSFGERVIHIKQDNKGLAAARNTGIRASHGEYIAFLDADDIYLPDKIEKQITFAKNNPQFDVVYCHMYHFYESNPNIFYRHQRPCASGYVFGKLITNFFGQADTLLIPKYVFDKVGLFDESFKFTEDWEMNLRIAYAGYRFGFMNEPLIKMRISTSSWGGINNQIGNKSFEVKLFEKVFSYVTPEDKLKYKIIKSLMNSKLRLSISYLTRGIKQDSIHILNDISFNSPKQIFVWLLKFIIYILPVKLLIFLSIMAVHSNRRFILKKVNSI